MTDLIPPENDPAAGAAAPPAAGRPTDPTGDAAPAAAGDARENLRRIAAAHTAASRDLEALVRRLPATPDPSAIAEYATLLAREEALRAERAAAATAVGLDVPSVGGG